MVLCITSRDKGNIIHVLQDDLTKLSIWKEGEYLWFFLETIVAQSFDLKASPTMRNKWRAKGMVVSHLFFLSLEGVRQGVYGFGDSTLGWCSWNKPLCGFGYLTFNLNIRVQFSLGGGGFSLSLSKADHVHDVCLLHMVQRENHHSTPLVHQ